MRLKTVFRIGLGLCCAATLLGTSLAEDASVENWPQFRGPGVMGFSEHPDLPSTWGADENITWKVPLAGMGWSSPVVWGDRIFITTAISAGEVEAVKKGLYFGGNRPPTKDVHEFRVICYDARTGKERWNKLVHKGVPAQARHLKNSYASETVVCDGESVYAYIGNVGLFVFDLDGVERWTKKWTPVKTRYGWGTAASPYLHEDRLYLINDNDEQSFLVALNKKTGEVIWRKDRNEGSNWSPPYVWENNQRTEIVTTGSGKVRSYSLDGEILWTLGGLSSITVPSPFAHDGLLYFGSGYVGDKNRPFFAIKPGARGDIGLGESETSNATIAWCQKQAAPYMPTPICYRDRIYVLLDRGMLSCYNAKTGAAIYEKQRLGSPQFNASPLAWNGKIFCFGERGETVVVEASDTFKVLHQNDLGELIMATPAISGSSLILRTDRHLYRIRSL